MNEALRLYIAGAGTLVVGLVIGFRLFRPAEMAAPPIVAMRQSAIQDVEYRYINPLLGLNLPATSHFPTLRKNMRDAIDQALDEKQARNISVYFKDANSGEWFGENLDELYSPASMMKVLTMIAYLKYAEVEPAVLTSKLEYDGKTDRNATEFFPSPVQIESGWYSIDTLIDHMIRYSDNNAALILNEYLAHTRFDVLNQAYLDLGIDKINPEDDYITVTSYSLMFRVLYNATYLSRAMSEKALGILAQTDFLRGIMAGVPQDLVVAHKFGEFGINDELGGVLKRELHDCGIIYDGEHPYLLCVMTKGNDPEKLASVVARISSVVYQSDDRLGEY